MTVTETQLIAVAKIILLNKCLLTQFRRNLF